MNNFDLTSIGNTNTILPIAQQKGLTMDKTSDGGLFSILDNTFSSVGDLLGKVVDSVDNATLNDIVKSQLGTTSKPETTIDKAVVANDSSLSGTNGIFGYVKENPLLVGGGALVGFIALIIVLKKI